MPSLLHYHSTPPQRWLWFGFFCLLGLVMIGQYREEIVTFSRTVHVPEQIVRIADSKDGNAAAVAMVPGINSGGLGFRIDLFFRPDNITEHGIFFQTADREKGLSIECTEGKLSVVFPGASGTPPTTLSFNVLPAAREWHHLTLSAITEGRIYATVDDSETLFPDLPVPFAVEHILIGADYSGEVKDVKAIVQKARPLSVGMSVYFVLRFLLLDLLIISLRKGRGALFPAYATPSAPRAADPIDPLLTLRAFACVMVLLGHTFLVIFPPAGLMEKIAADSPLWLLTSSPWAGVWVFFTLSGYLMGKGFFTHRYPMSGEGFIHFYRNRLYRIVPVYLFVVFLVTVLAHPNLLKWNGLLSIVPLIDVLTFDYPQIPVGLFWSIGTEMHFYALAPYLCLVLFPLLCNRPWRMAVFLCALWAGEIIYRHGAYVTTGSTGFFILGTYFNIVSNLDLFLTGLLGNIMLQKWRHCLPARHLLATGLMLMILLYCAVSYVSGHGVAGNQRDLMWFVSFLPTFTALMTVLIIICFERAREEGALGNAWVRAVLARIQPFGILTFCIYSLHEPVLLSLQKITTTGDAWHSAGNALAAWSVIAIFSLLTFYAIELPFDRKRKVVA